MLKALNEISASPATARTGAEAVQIIQCNPNIDLILMDIRLPGIDGCETTKQLRQFNQKVVIVAQTAFTMLGDKEKALAGGCNNYITKPLRRPGLFPVYLGSKTTRKQKISFEHFRSLMNCKEYKNALFIMTFMSAGHIDAYGVIKAKSEKLIELIQRALKR